MNARLSRADWDRYGARLAAEDRAKAAEMVAGLPDAWRRRVLWKFGELFQRDQVAGNTWLRETASALRSASWLPLGASDADLIDFARASVDALWMLAQAGKVADPAVLREKLARAAQRRGVEAPGADYSDAGAVARLLCAQWWVRALRKSHGRSVETHAIRLGYVRQGKAPYVSDENLRRRKAQRARNRKGLEATEATNQHGEIRTLAELAERSNANPAVKRGELMTRIKGFELIAAGLGHVAEFWTGTAPTRFHAQLQKGGANPKHSHGLTPRDAQAWLCAAWARFRAWAHRKGVRFYGFRIAEPHHDGCPHWHLLLWMPAAFAAEARAKFAHYWIADEAHDKGRRDAACKFEAIDPARGGAVAYVAKYVAKNIDGMGLEKDLFGNESVTVAQRVDAWASTWGIRQFQQVGGAPVGVWRELRRMRDFEGLEGRAERARIAAAEASGPEAGQGWADYVEAMGGPTVERRELPLRVAYTDEGMKWDAVEVAQVVAKNRYGEAAAPTVFGVVECFRGVEWARHVSRVNRWEIKRNGDVGRNGGRIGDAIRRFRVSASRGAFSGAEADHGASQGPKGSSKAAAPAGAQAPGLGFERRRAASAPWTRVHNCTGGCSSAGDFESEPGGLGSENADGSRFKVAGRAVAAGRGPGADPKAGRSGRDAGGTT